MTGSWLQLSLTKGLGPTLIRRLIEMVGSADAACAVSVKQLASVEGIDRRASEIAASLRQCREEAKLVWEQTVGIGARVICPDDDEYPILLRAIHDPPPVLFLRGALEPRDLHAVAIVGSRKCSLYGREQAERFGALLAGTGLTVISGGARGIDSAAHRGAMQNANGRTIAVLGCGVDVAFPAENEGLFRQIAERGAVMSEFPPGVPPLPEHFPRRNRVVSGMSRGVLVVEADVRSGALITARIAADDHGRPVFAVPGRVDNAMSAGPHKLIREGATLVTELVNILEDLGELPDEVNVPGRELAPLFAPSVQSEPVGVEEAAVERKRSIPAHLDEESRRVMEFLDVEPVAVDVIVERSGMEASVVLQKLTVLSLKGLVRRGDGQTFARRR